MSSLVKHTTPAIEGGIPVRKNFLVFGQPVIKKEDIDEVVDSLKAAWIGTGPKVAKFEELIREYSGAKYALAVNSCTAGLHLALLACGVGEGDEVITTPLTFAASINVIEHVGATPVLADVDPKTMNIDPNEIEKKITKKAKAIIPVHMAGRVCDMNAIMKIARKHKLKVVEDSAHALGAEYHGKKAGNIGDISSYSFYATKNLTTGEGGMVTTNDDDLAKFVKVNALHGMSSDAWKRYSDEGFKHYLVEYPGFKYNMMDLQAAIGIHQLARFKASQKRREEIWDEYNKAFADLPLILPSPVEPKTKHAYHLYTILVDIDSIKASREEVQTALHAENIGIGIHFIAAHLHPFYMDKYKFKRGDFPHAEFISDRTISIPFSQGLSKKDVKDVIAAVRKVMLYYTESTPRQRKMSLPQATKDINGKRKKK